VRFWTVLLALLGLGAAGGLGPAPPAALAQQSSPASGQSWTSSISSGFKQGVDKVGQLANPKPRANPSSPKDDPVSLRNGGKPGPELNVAIARLYQESGRPAEAEQQYQLALKANPDYLPALLGYAQLQDRTDQPDEALRLYERAASVHPMQAPVYNNMGLFYARRGRLDEAVAAMTRAIQLDPKNRLYRNNVATVLVEQGRIREAFSQLREVHGDAVAYYNLGYLLNKKGQTQAALQHFALALRADPSMAQAERWIEHLQRQTTQARLPQHPAAAGVRITSQMSPEDAQAGTSAVPQGAVRQTGPTPYRLPPTAAGESAGQGPSLPGISYGRSTPPDAPMPPPRSPAVRPLPKVE
jgi:tetratricopeptide (TPR) repeat protein